MASGPTLGNAYVQIIAGAEGISGQITNVLAPEAATAGTKTGGIFSRLFSSKVVKGFAIAGTALAAGVGIGANALKNGIKDAAAYGDYVDKMSQKIGFNSDEFQKWDYVLQRAGTSINKMLPAMKTLSTQATSNSEAFQQLGISQEDLQKMSPGQLFTETVKRLSAMENETERMALASKLLGRGATELGPLFNGGTAAIEEQMEIAEKYGMVMPEAAVKASAAFQDSVTTMTMTMTGLKNRMMAEFLPAATQLTDGLGKLFAGDMSGVDDIAAGIEGIAAKIAELAPKIWEVAKNLGSQLLQGIMANAGELGTKAGQLVGPLLQGIAAKMPDIIMAAGRLVFNFAKGIIQSLPQIYAAILRMEQTILKGLGAALWAKVKAAANRVKDSFLAPINALKDKVKSIIDRIKGFFSFKVSKPHVPLPHFGISPAGWKIKDLLKGSIPHLSVKWFAEGGIVDGPTLFGAGEAGPEAIMPLDKLKDYTAIDYDRLAGAIVSALSGVQTTTTVQIDGKEVARTTAPFMETELNRRQKFNNRKLGYLGG